MAEDATNAMDQAEPSMVPADDAAPKMSLGDRMKSYEAATELHLDTSLPWVVRLDGHKFSSYTKFFKRPFDDRIHNCMVAACKALLVEFQPTTVFTCSDEITLCFPAFDSLHPELAAPAEQTPNDETAPKPDNRGMTMFFSGRIQKVATLMSGLASVAFDRALREQVFDPATEQKLIDYVETHTPYFDARVFNVPDVSQIVSNLIWRSHYDYRRNSISQLGRAHFSQKQLHGVNSTDVQNKLLTEKGVNWEDLPGKFKYGSFFKRQQFVKTVVINDKDVDAIRTRTVEISFKFAQNGQAERDFLMTKYIPADFEKYIVVTHQDRERAPRTVVNKK